MKQFWFLFLFAAFSAAAQSPKAIHFQKDRSLIYFFQVEKKSDTIFSGKNDQFFLLVPDSTKENVRIDIDNAKVNSTKNDSIVRLIYLPGLRYEAAYTSPPSQIGTPVEKTFLSVHVNGASQVDRQLVRVQFIDRRTNKVLLENQFYFGN